MRRRNANESVCKQCGESYLAATNSRGKDGGEIQLSSKSDSAKAAVARCYDAVERFYDGEWVYTREWRGQDVEWVYTREWRGQDGEWVYTRE